VAQHRRHQSPVSASSWPRVSVNNASTLLHVSV
jgi:hypothetical protein